MTPAECRASDALPSRDECLSILRAVGCGDAVIAHCLAVAATAVKMAERCNARVRVVEAGALLHDIGRSRTHSIDHALAGADIVRGMGLPEEIALIIERHIGAGIPKAEAEGLGLPARDFIPLTLEEKIVAHADNLISGSERVPLERTLAHLASSGMPDTVIERLRSLHKELSSIARIDIDEIQ